MVEETLETPCGVIRYWLNRDAEAWSNAADAPALVLLPGLTADHRLFDGKSMNLNPRTAC
jgi:hypothetical protein